MIENVTKLTNALSGTTRVVSTQIIHCQHCGNQQEEAIVNIFDDGYIEVSCPCDPNKTACLYRHPSRPVSFFRKPLVIISLAIGLCIGVTFLAAWLYPIIKRLSHT
jgi:hypothetical protein